MKTCIIAGEYIKLNQFLKKEGIASTGGEAKLIILDGNVKVNDIQAHEIRKKLKPGDIIKVYNEVYTIEGDNRCM